MAKSKETLVWSRRWRGRWEFATAAPNRVTGRQQWERRDGSYICDVGDELATMPVPPRPTIKGKT